MRLLSSVLTCAVTFAWLANAGVAKAEEASPNGKGIAGGALLGAELVMDVEAALKVKSPWAYLGGGLAGAAAGGVGGYFVEQSVDSARIPMLMLAGGITLAIPTTVAVLSASAYEPPATYVIDQQPADEPVADPARATTPAPAPAAPTPPPATAPNDTTPPATTPAPSAPPPGPGTPSGALRGRHIAKRSAPRRLPPALIDVDPNQVSISVPNVEVREVFTRAEVAMGAPRATEVRIPVLNVLF
ncbi:MAG TPA: hypothetical protein VFQ35_00940 [Polyangiaceae bacterium]|nr:hypothetical protein [Polyangiaceae bacterium]